MIHKHCILYCYQKFLVAFWILPSCHLFIVSILMGWLRLVLHLMLLFQWELVVDDAESRLELLDRALFSITAESKFFCSNGFTYVLYQPSKVFVLIGHNWLGALSVQLITVDKKNSHCLFLLSSTSLWFFYFLFHFIIMMNIIYSLINLNWNMIAKYNDNNNM